MHVTFHMIPVMLKADHKFRKTNFIFIYVVLQNTSLLLQLWQQRRKKKKAIVLGFFNKS